MNGDPKYMSVTQRLEWIDTDWSCGRQKV